MGVLRRTSPYVLGSSMKETADMVTRIAEILEEQGVETANICSQIAKILPYSEHALGVCFKTSISMLRENGGCLARYFCEFYWL